MPKSNIGNPWVAVGDDANWERGFENGIWGLKPQIEHHWQKINSGDMVLFYCVAPVKGFIGAGVVRAKFKQDRPFWKEELSANQVMWPFRFEFDITHLLPLQSWRTHCVSNKEFNLAILAGINPIKKAYKALQVLERLKFIEIQPTKPEKQIAATIFKIGKIQRMVVESDFIIDGDYLDVVWKRTIRSVPTFAFSVSLENEIDRSISTLKHAFDLWNSRPFLVTSETEMKNAAHTLNGVYQEFSRQLKILSVVQIQELYRSKKKYYDLEEKYGLR